MRRRVTTAIAILSLSSVALACSLIRPNRPLTWNLMLEVDAAAPERAGAVQQTVRIVEQRLDAFGIHNSRVLPQGTPPNGHILVSLPDVPDRERLKQLITAGGLLEFVKVVSPPSPSMAQTYRTREEAIASMGPVPPNLRLLPYAERSERQGPAASQQPKWVIVESPAILDGSQLRDAVATQIVRGSDDYQIAFSLRPEGAIKFETWTSSHINDYLGVVLNGEVKSIAFIKSPISDSGEISGRFNKASAEDLALVLRSGALPAPVKIVEESAAR